MVLLTGPTTAYQLEEWMAEMSELPMGIRKAPLMAAN
jgi:hypothetical protein